MSDIWDRDNKCHKKRVFQNHTGGAIAEVILALVLSLLLIETVLQLTLVGINNIVQAGQRTTACTYAESLLEEMKARPDLLRGAATNTALRVSELDFSIPDPENMQATIQLLPMEGTAALCQVKVNVTVTKGGRTWEENLTGLIPSPAQE